LTLFNIRETFAHNFFYITYIVLLRFVHGAPPLDLWCV
jgi:hypothetical protein